MSWFLRTTYNFSTSHSDGGHHTNPFRRANLYICIWTPKINVTVHIKAFRYTHVTLSAESHRVLNLSMPVGLACHARENNKSLGETLCLLLCVCECERL